jgi:CheY-like chemotaxis protein
MQMGQYAGTRNGRAARLKVLVADDEQVIANSLAAILNHSGFEARAVYNGKAAVDSVGSFEPDIFISDVLMPKMTGIEAAIEILAQCPACKVLLFSGVAATADLFTRCSGQGISFRDPLETGPSRGAPRKDTLYRISRS